MNRSPIELLFTGSVPLRPAAAVFEKLQQHCGARLRRMPDGEQNNWVFGAWETLIEHPAIEATQDAQPVTSADTPFGRLRAPRFNLIGGASAADISVKRFGLADTINDSYRQLTELKQRGVVPEAVRLQATVPGPGTTGGLLASCSWDEIITMINPPLITDVHEIADAVPPDELAVQLDLPVEIQLEEWRRSPQAFDVAYASERYRVWPGWDLDKLLTPVVEIANQVPSEAELGFHLCGLWHIDPRGGQDIQVHVDAANFLSQRVTRRIDYLHMPIIPEHDVEDYAKLGNLRLAPATKLFLGLIHREDGIQGAKRRIEMAQAVVQEFGVGYFCGLRDLNQVGPQRLEEVLELHGQVAKL